MSQNPINAVECGIEVFGSWVSDIDPESVPLGCSPDSRNMASLPGSVFTRGALQRAQVIAPGVNIPYEKTYTDPTNVKRNLILDSDGRYYTQPIGSPATLAFNTGAGLFARSVTAFGREYIAISDGLNGQEIPLQFDGVNFDRVTQDGPGAPPTVRSIALPPSQMVSSGNTLVRQNNVVTCNTATPNGLQVGYQVQISNVPDSNATSVVETNTGNPQANQSVWDENGGQYRSLFNPGSSALADFQAVGFGFNVPAAATILGVVASFPIQSQATTSGNVSQVALWNGGVIGTAKTPATPITTTAVTTSYGSAADDWGATLTPAIVNSPTFGFALACVADSVRLFIDFPFTVQVFYTLSGSGTVAEIESIVIDNETNPGLALVTTSGPHGLIPGISVSIVGVEPGTVADVANAQWVAGITTLTTTQAHNLTPGAIIQVADVTTSTTDTTFSFNGTHQVLSVPAPNQVTFSQTPINSDNPDVINATADTGAITVSWPIPDNTPTPTYFEVESCPTATTFYIQLSYSDATWDSGTVGFIWEGIFFVTAVLSPTEFQYQQNGPNGATTAVGTVTPWGQAAPGQHQLRMSFLTRQGYLTRPSPPVLFIANGGQYLQVSDMGIGPDNVVARVLEFTGALGSLFYYIPVPAQINGTVVSTATQVNDNTTTSLILDFSDNTLFAALGTSIPGNNTPAQIVIDGALGFSALDTMLVTWGQRNTVQSLQSMGFEGGNLSGDIANPLGWTVRGAGGSLTNASFSGKAWAISGVGGSLDGFIEQTAYLDPYGAPILQGNTQYSIRLRITTGLNAGFIQAHLQSVSTGFNAIATIQVRAGSLWYDAEFGIPTPEDIPKDIKFGVFAVAVNGVVTLDEMSLYYTDNPYTDSNFNASYGDNPEAFDGVTGVFGPSEDTRKVMDIATVRDIPYILTLEPEGRLHEVESVGTTLPSGWGVREVAANCGVLSAFSLTRSKSVDDSSSGGEIWFAWASESGARIFGGNQPMKISQEIQPNWYSPTQKTKFPNQINMAAALTCWAFNDPVERVLYFGLPIGTATSPSQVYYMSYRNMDTAEQISYSPPYRITANGTLAASDNARKWSYWPIAMANGGRIYLDNTELTTVFFSGQGFGNTYKLNPEMSTDDDYGIIDSYYITACIPTKQQEEALALNSGRKLLSYLAAYVQTVGNVVITPLIDRIGNVWPLSCVRNPGLQPDFDLEWGGGSAQGQRMFFKIAAQALPQTTDARINISKLIPWIKKNKILIRGAAK